MRLLIERDAAVRALSRVQGVVKSKPKAPIWSHVLLSAGATTLTVTTGNGDQQATDCAPANVERPGVTTVEARRMLDVVQGFPEGGEVLIELDDSDSRLIVKCGRSRFRLATLPPDEFAQFPSLDAAPGGAISRDLLRRLITRTRFAVSTELDTRPAYASLYLEAAEQDGAQWLTAVGLDGKIMAVAETPLPDGFEGLSGTCLTPGFVDEMARLLGDAPETVELYASDRLSEFRAGTTEVTAKLNDVPYPNYRYAIPADNPLMVKLDVDLTMASINRALLVTADDKYRTVRLGFNADRLTVFAKAKEGSDEVSDELPIDYAGPHAELTFNAHRMKALLRAVTGENALWSMSADPKAAAILIRDSNDPDCRFVLVQNKG